MRNAILAALLAAAAASAATWALASAAPRTPAPSPAPPDPALRAAVEDLTREVAALRRRVDELAARPDATAPAARVPGVRSPEAPTASSAEEAAVALPRTESDPAPPSLERFREVLEWDESGFVRDRRRRWLLRSETEVAAWFGVPDEIEVQDGGKEVWLYEIPLGTTFPDGSPKHNRYYLEFHRGRVTKISGRDW